MNDRRPPDGAACRRARERLLAADPSALRAEDRTPLAAHLRACPGCRAVAEAILAAEDRLARALEEVRPSIDPAEAVSLAELGRERAGRPDPEAAGDARDRRRRLWPLVPLAAAAAGALLLLGPKEGGDPGGSSLSPTPPIVDAPLAAGPGGGRDPAPVGFALDVPERERAVVFATRDPRITVVWFYRP